MFILANYKGLSQDFLNKNILFKSSSGSSLLIKKNKTYSYNRIKQIHMAQWDKGHSIGNWHLDKDHNLILNSENKSYLLKVKESYKKEYDGKYVFLFNITKDKNLAETLVLSGDFSFQKLLENPFQILIKDLMNPIHSSISYFRILIFPDNFSFYEVGQGVYQDHLYTNDYYLENKLSNYFEISILNYLQKDFSFIIFNNEIIKYRKNKIYWNGEVFKKDVTSKKLH